VDEDVVRDGNVITAVYFGYLPDFLHTIIAALTE
jgi:hypothetical protein